MSQPALLISVIWPHLPGVRLFDCIQEYQEFMERIRAKAQSAIDTANRDFQSSKTMLTSKMNLMVD